MLCLIGVAGAKLASAFDLKGKLHVMAENPWRLVFFRGDWKNKTLTLRQTAKEKNPWPKMLERLNCWDLTVNRPWKAQRTHCIQETKHRFLKTDRCRVLTVHLCIIELHPGTFNGQSLNTEPDIKNIQSSRKMLITTRLVNTFLIRKGWW